MKSKMDSHSEARISRIASSFERATKAGSVSVLPDYFVDRFLRIDSLDDFVSLIKKKSEEGGGGSIREGIIQDEVKGGNAVNLGCALGMYGVKVNLFAIANGLSSQTLKCVVDRLPSVNLELVEGRSGYTVALEFMDGGRPVNVMVSDIGDLEKFDGSSLKKMHWGIIKQSKIAGVVNWGSNKLGSELCKRLFGFARQNGVKTFFDSADVSELQSNLPAFKRMILDERLIDYFSMNDNEARIMARIFSKHALPQSYSEDELKSAALCLADASGSRVDIHTRRLSLSCVGKDVTVAYCHKVDQKIVTGAGDVWDAANILAYLTGLEADDRLHLANAAAGLYVSRLSAEPPTPQEVLQFMKSEHRKGE
jgi:ribokinase